MKKDFKQWKDDYGLEFEPNYSKETELDCKAAFEAGQQSKQAKIDELQARIDGALKELELLNYYRTGNSDNAINILKGNKDENY